ncbi:hypothetical protein ACN2XU_09120 [Primorskyibacter sp. 2E107]|uniref:hypothetical protein n=1 Tax=Primorskyibacter sp. 2E107 TaxID=3403458 RepID=UPI003AF79616
MKTINYAVASMTLLASGASAQTLLSGDHSIDGKICFGTECTASESFPPTVEVMIKAPDNRFYINDTSTVAGDPTNDWALVFNDESQNGEEYFEVYDVDSDSVLMHLAAGAREDSIFLDSNSNVGFGTSIPLSNLHIVDGTQPTFRLEETSSGQSWEFLNGGDLGIIDRSNLTEPFRIVPGSPTDTMHLEANGFVGLGTDQPAARLHVSSANGTAKVLVEDTGPKAVREMFAMKNNGGSYFTFDNTDSGTTWYFVHENNAPNRFIITDAVADGPEMTLTADGDLTIEGELFTAGSCAAGCDRVFDADYPLPTIAEQGAMMREMKHLPNVGPTPEDGPFNLTRMSGGMLNELEKAHLYIGQLSDALEAQQRVNADLEARLARIEVQMQAQ